VKVPAFVGFPDDPALTPPPAADRPWNGVVPVPVSPILACGLLESDNLTRGAASGFAI